MGETWQVVVAWVLWSTRNNMAFENREIHIKEIIETVEITSWNWLRARKKGLAYPVSSWIANHSSCLHATS